MSDADDQLIIDAVREVIDPSTASTIADAIRRVPPAALSRYLHARFDDDDLVVLATGLPASPGAASGRIVVDAESAVEAGDRGDEVILVRTETTPDDVLGMQSARGIVTTRGGLASHAAVVARGWGIPAVVGASEVTVVEGGIAIGGSFHPVGTSISIDGHTGQVSAGTQATSTSAPPAELATLLHWADLVRGDRIAIRANADTAEGAAHARHLGADGIGLCRTEHMFLAADRLRLVRRLILSDDHILERDTLAELEVVQQLDFEAILTAMDGLPVTVRLLDPPLHEFLPDFEQLVVAEATGQLDDEMRVELAAVRRLREANPMIGTRGVRLGVVRPGVYQLQVRALARAVAAGLVAGRDPHVEIMIPLVMGAAELAMARGWVDDALEEVGVEDVSTHTVNIGAMVETPRAALVAASISEHADFLSFGTNDLTQLTFAFSRDDVETNLVPAYLELGVLASNPFEHLDEDGVGRLIRMTCDEARAVKPELKIGICGEHAGDPASMRFLIDAGIDYLSCSPYRIPIARLAVAQALLDAGTVPEELIARLTSDAVAAATHLDARSEHDRGTPTWSAEGAEDDFVVLHALKIKGFSQTSTLSELATLSIERVETILQSFAEQGLVRYFEARDLWQLTDAGRDRHGSELVHVATRYSDALRVHYPDFLALNTRVKELCVSWQMRDGEPNDHTDSDYDAVQLAALEALNRECRPVFDGFAGAVARYDAYRHRLTAATARAVAGETSMFTGVMCGSFHDVWMELHEDLIQLLAVDRRIEGSF